MLYRMKERLTIKLAWALPRFLVRWVGYRIAAHATTGKWGGEHPDNVPMLTALQRWEAPNA
jgi:hypothetical protein